MRIYDVNKLKVGTRFKLMGNNWNPNYVNIPSTIIEIGEGVIYHTYDKDIFNLRHGHVILPAGKIDHTDFHTLQNSGFELIAIQNNKPEWL